MSVRGTLKACLEAGLVRSGVPALHRVARAGRALVLAYHNVVPDSQPPFGDRSLHLPLRLFVRQLESLLATHTVVPLEQLLEAPAAGRRPRAAITFDDGYRGAVRLGVAELARRGLPATLFVVPGFVGKGPFWWDALAAERGVDAGLRGRALDELQGKDAAVRSWAARHGIPSGAVPEWALVASEEELRSATRNPGITLGSHTWTHPNLARLTAAELGEELRRPLTWLRERFASVTPWLSYPYGLAAPAVEAAARDAGYAAALALGGGSFPPTRVNRWAVPRENIPSGLSPNGFVIRSSGL
jgi:peptidoglycan/xylan/chitin deacetylase (PgdA/CDA1 family)